MNSRAALKQSIAFCHELLECYKTISLSVGKLRCEVTLKVITVQKNLLTTLQRNVFLEKNKTKHKTGVLDKSATTNNTKLRNLPSKIYYLLF